MKRQNRKNKSKKKQQQKMRKDGLSQQQKQQTKQTQPKLVSSEKKKAETTISIPVKELLKHIWKDNKIVGFIKNKIRKPKKLIGDQGIAESWDIVGFLVTTGCSFVTFLFVLLGILAIIQ